MKAQNCPLCGKKARKKVVIHSYCCCYKNKECKIRNKWFTIEIWNRMRFAPDGEKLDMSPGASFYSWMDPEYPEGK